MGDTPIYVVAGDGNWEPIGTVEGGPVRGQNGELVADEHAEGIRFVTDHEVTLEVDTSSIDRALLDAVTGRPDSGPLVEDVWAQIRRAHLQGIPTENHHVHMDRETLRGLLRDTALPVDHELATGEATMFGLPVVVDDRVPPGTAMLVDPRPFPGVTAAEAAAAFARAGDAFRQFGEAMANVRISTEHAAWSLRNMVLRWVVCARCRDRAPNDRRLEPGLCDECNEARFWQVVAGLMVALVVLAVVAKVVAGG